MTIVRRNEAGHIVDVAMGIVAGDAAPQPEHLVGAEIVAQDSSSSSR